MRIITKYIEAFKRKIVSKDETGGITNELQKKNALLTRIHVVVTYILFNLGLFLPIALFDVSDTVKIQLNLEVAIVFSLWAIFAGRWGQRGLKGFSLGFGLFYILALIYRLYASVLSGIYQMEPNFYNDYRFVSGAISFFFDALNLSFSVYLAVGISIIVLIGIIFWGAWKTFKSVSVPTLGRSFRLGLIAPGLIALFVGSGFPKQSTDLQMSVSSVTTETIENIHRSLETREEIKTFVTFDPTDTYDYTQYPLSQKPDVYFIFIESYGSVVYQREHFTSPFVEMVESMERSLANDNWSTVTSLSEAPIWGGGSWMSYTSTLFGVLIDQQVEYDALRQKYTEQEYPNIGRYFSSQAYEYMWVVPIDRRLPAKREADDHNFYGAKQWITFDTLDYEGPLFGWGPSAPDQFTLGFVQEYVSQIDQPAFVVYLTQNSHYPWTPLPPLLDDWRALENLDMEDGVLNEGQKKGLSLRESRQNYLRALDNSLVSLEKFITSLENENSVIVLIGDHQPPTVSRREDGFGTMVHIISQDVDFLKSFHKYGFVNGLVLESLEPKIRHEGLYSLFVRNLIGKYGKSPWLLPPYLPNGHQ